MEIRIEKKMYHRPFLKNYMKIIVSLFCFCALLISFPVLGYINYKKILKLFTEDHYGHVNKMIKLNLLNHEAQTNQINRKTINFCSTGIKS